MASGKIYAQFPYVSGISLNNLTTGGIYYCDGCTNFPSGAPWTAFVVEVCSVGSVIKQIARPVYADNGFCFERRYASGTWDEWIETGRTVVFKGDTSTTQYIRKPGDPNYGSFLITGTSAGDGGVVIGVIINNGSITSARNLMTNAAWSGNLTITYSVSNNVGYIGLKTTSSAGTQVCIIGG